MKKSEIIHAMKEPVMSVAKRFSPEEIHPTFVSSCIAYCLWLLDNKTITDTDIKDKNNPMGIIDPSTQTTVEYSSIEESILNAIKAKCCENPRFLEKYDSIAKGNNLYRFDKMYLDSINTNLIDLPEEKCTPNVDVYSVKNSDGTIAMKTDNIKDAKAEVKKDYTKEIYNSRGTLIDAIQSEEKATSVKSLTLKAGSHIICNGMNMYRKRYDKLPEKSIKGDYVLYDGKEVNGRYAICFDNLSTQILGYVNAKDLDIE